MEISYQDINRKTIDRWVDDGWEWGKPISREVYAAAKNGQWDVKLTPVKFVPHDWFGDLKDRRVLGLAAGGGQQMPIFAALGAKCTVLDYSEKQLESERMVAQREGYDITIVRADMTKRLPFDDNSFDLIFHPVSNCYVYAVLPIWRECARVLKPGGRLLAGLDNGFNYAFDEDETKIINTLPFNPLEDEGQMRQLQKDERLSTQQKAQRAREIAKKESEKLFIGTEVVHNPVKEFVPLKEVKVGQEVCIAELNQLATVLALPDKNGDVLVRAGIIKTKVPLKGLKQPDKLIKEPQPKTKAQQRYSRLTCDANRPNGRVERVQRSAKMELNLLGLTVDEALPEVDAYIDRAILNGQTVVYLIHGNGTGALRTAIHKHLRGNRMVKSFRLGRYGEGESGVTVVELK